MYGGPMNLEPLILLTHNYIIGLLENFFKVIICDESLKARIHHVLGFKISVLG
jgi:predicted metallopeptidase